MTDIFIANEVVGVENYRRLRKLHQTVRIRVGIDNTVQLRQMEEVFAAEEKPLEVLIEYDVGECRTGVTNDEQLTALVKAIGSAGMWP
jgi:D-serine deaminase-like pyridoxal phosphate-dependent protein